MYSEDVFEDCMNGYPGFNRPKPQQTKQYSKTPIFEPSAPSVAPVPQASVVPVLDIPKVSLGNAAAPVNIPPVADISTLPANPMLGKMSREEALRFIQN